MQYPWHPFFGHLYDIYCRFKKAHIETYRCCLSGQPGQKRLDIPTWMFDQLRCSKMKLSNQPYCSLGSLKQLLLLFAETSSTECIIGQIPHTFTERGDVHARLRPTEQNNRHAPVPSSRSLSDDMGKHSCEGASDSVDERNGKGISHSNRTERQKT